MKCSKYFCWYIKLRNIKIKRNSKIKRNIKLSLTHSKMTSKLNIYMINLNPKCLTVY